MFLFLLFNFYFFGVIPLRLHYSLQLTFAPFRIIIHVDFAKGGAKGRAIRL